MNDQVDSQNLVHIIDEADLVRVRHALRGHARAAGLSLVEETKFITAGSELARNIVSHATGGRGEVSIERLITNSRCGVRATFVDNGPGIGDLDSALTDGFSTVGSMGLGLPGARRLIDEMTITSSAGSGTTVVITKWRR
ncbi:MAG: anti-sigma regulatory factor [Mycolicibacterium sp.]|uniref:anti-sigma regulatory factor n=1 Tax=Mycolicibacterium sp. TaxID=2320850 RepID=UPI003D0F741C